MIEVNNLTKDYIDEDVITQALRGISFSIEEGEFVSIMGPSGSGKSTLLHVLSLLDRPTGGEYRFLGHPTNDLSDEDLAHKRNKDIGFIFQSFNLLGRSTVYQNVEMPLLYSDVPMHSRHARVVRAVEAVGLEDKTYSEASKLSGGQKQRVAIARALVNEPNIIFADEPTGNLDSASGLHIMQILAELNKQGKTIILVTHETNTAEFGSRLITIQDGLVEHDGPISRHRLISAIK